MAKQSGRYLRCLIVVRRCNTEWYVGKPKLSVLVFRVRRGHREEG